MLLVRQPMPRWLHIALGSLSIGLLIGAYAWLAHARQQARRHDAAEKLTHVEVELAAARQQLSELTASDPTVAPLERQIARWQRDAESLARNSRELTDRTVPTLGSLYRDGLLRAIQPQGLRKDEYWLWEDTLATSYRLFAGLSVGVLLSVALGILMGSYAPVEAFFMPPLSFLAKIPPTAMLAVYFVLVGTTFEMYVTMLALGTLPTLAQTVFQSARKDVPASLVFKAYTLGASDAELIWNVIYKQVLPRVIDAVRLQVGPAMVLLIAAEWMVAGEGFGYRLRLFFTRTDMTVVYVYLVILGIAGLAVDHGLTWLRRRLCPWFGE